MTTNPYISILICTFNRCESLKGTLESLLTLEHAEGFDYEVVIVDNNSTDATRRVIGDFEGKFSGRLRYCFEPAQGLSPARNNGIREARGEIMAFTDDDVIVARGWLDEIGRLFRQKKADAMGGRVVPLFPAHTPRWIIDHQDVIGGPLVKYDYGMETVPYSGSRMIPFIGANMAYRKQVFDELGPFKLGIGAGFGTMGEDSEMFRRMDQAGKRIYYCGKASVQHKLESHRMNLRYLANWAVASGRYYTRRNPVDNSLVHCGRVPRYLWRQLLTEAFKVTTNYFRKDVFLKHWLEFYICWGKIKEFRTLKSGAANTVPLQR